MHRVGGFWPYLYTDNFYTSVDLYQYLFDNKIYACGTIKGSRKHPSKGLECAKMWVHICLKCFQLGEIALFAAKVLGNPMAVNLKMSPRIGHPRFHMCHAQAYFAGCVMYSYASRRIATAEITKLCINFFLIF